MKDPTNFVAKRVEQGSDHIMSLDNSVGDGWPDLFEVVGQVKCLLCQGLAENEPVCPECRDAIKLFRGAANVPNLRHLLELLSRPGIFELLERITDEALGDYFMKRLRGE